ncbi:MAG TPA: class I SAM-dependent methyltransferase, partial [Thermoanaerobaculia bacterium]|nr:class I SAM-dependent methyltransferase [Thermoanaerobaculia bacterium]
MEILRRLRRGQERVRWLRLDYRIRARPRYGYGAPAHPGLWQRIDVGRTGYAALLDGIASLAPSLNALAAVTTEPAEPRWDNPFFPPLDGIVLYGLLALRRPRLYIEIGSGDSTRFARRAVRDFALPTRIVSIDPEPRAEIDALCDEVVRSHLEDADLGLFADLRRGDVVFHDGSHRVFQNSDT